MASFWCFWISHRIILADTQIDFPGFEGGWYRFFFKILNVFLPERCCPGKADWHGLIPRRKQKELLLL